MSASTVIDMADLKLAHDDDILARTLVGEARGEGQSGMESVACIVMNRVAKQTWYGKSPKQVCLKPWQFSAWNKNDPNRAIIENLDIETAIYREALKIARRAIAGQLIDPTKGATHYYDRRMPTPPGWAAGKIPCAILGHHLFFNDIN